MDENSFIFWHRRLGHIFIERIKRLVNDEVLNTLDFTNFSICIDCIKEKQTNKTIKGPTRSSNFFEIICTNIRGPFNTICLNVQ